MNEQGLRPTEAKFVSLSAEKRSFVLAVMEGVAVRRLIAAGKGAALSQDDLQITQPEVNQMLDQMVNKAATMDGGLERVQACIARVRAASAGSEKQR